MKAHTNREEMIKVSAWIPKNKLANLTQTMKNSSQSECLRLLIDQELERLESHKTHQKLYGIATDKDFDDRLL